MPALRDLTNTKQSAVEPADKMPAVRDLTDTKQRAVGAADQLKSQSRIMLKPIKDDGCSAIHFPDASLPLVFGRETDSRPTGSGVWDKRISRQHAQLLVSWQGTKPELRVTALGSNPIAIHRIESSEVRKTTVLLRGEEGCLALGDQLSMIIEVVDSTSEQDVGDITYVVVEESAEPATDTGSALQQDRSQATTTTVEPQVTAVEEKCDEKAAAQDQSSPQEGLLLEAATKLSPVKEEEEEEKADDDAAAHRECASTSPPPPPSTPEREPASPIHVSDASTSPMPSASTPEGEWLLRLMNDLQFLVAGSRGARRVRYRAWDYIDQDNGEWDIDGERSDLRLALEHHLGKVDEIRREKQHLEMRLALEMRLTDRHDHLFEGLRCVDDVHKFFERRQRGPADGQITRLKIEAAVRIAHPDALDSYVASNGLTSTGGFDINPLAAHSNGGETFLFHGTNEASVANIQATGRPSVRFAEPGMLGKGIYGAPDPRKSANYCKSGVNGRFMFICRFNLEHALHAGPHTGHRNTLFDEFCVFNDTHVVVLWMLKLQ